MGVWGELWTKINFFWLNFKKTRHYVLLIGVRKLTPINLYYSVFPTSSMTDSGRDREIFTVSQQQLTYWR